MSPDGEPRAEQRRAAEGLLGQLHLRNVFVKHFFEFKFPIIDENVLQIFDFARHGVVNIIKLFEKISIFQKI